MVFPESIRVELQQVNGISDMKVSDLMYRARILVGNQPVGVGAVAQSIVKKGSGGSIAYRDRSGKSGQSPQAKIVFRGKCFNPDGPHMARNCPIKKTEKRSYTCSRCGEEGHFANQCESEN